MTDPLPAGFYPFWFWNDRLMADEIRWQVAEMARQGVRGFFIHSRQGLGQPYLSEAFFEMVDVAVAVAEKHGLTVHLYDEYPYPSGIAGGQVTLGQPQFHATELIQQVCTVEGGPVRLELPAGKVLSVMAYPLVAARPELAEGCEPDASTRPAGQSARTHPDWTRGIDLRNHVGPSLVVDSYRETGLTRYNQKRYFASRPTPVLEATLPDGPQRIVASIQVEVRHHKYWDHFADVLNPEAVQQFINLTHERYRQRYGEKFGKSIRSIFVDETRPGWSARLPEAFRAEYGYDLCACLPALQDETHPDHLRVAYDLYRLQYRLFCVSWEEPISSWCRAHHLAYSGEKPSLRMAQLRYMDIPGCEPGHTKAGAVMDLMQPTLRGNAKATASASYFYGKEGALDECYHSLGWSGTLQDAKLMADGQLLAGIRYLVPHGFFYSTHALRKHDAPPTFFFQAPYWPLFGKLAEHVDRIGQLFEGTHIDAQILLIEPSSGIPNRADLAAYTQLQALLMGNHLDFHFADTDILESGRIQDGRLLVRDLAIRLLILPPMRVIEAPLQSWLTSFEAADGQVIYCDNGFAADDVLRRVRSFVAPSLSCRIERTALRSGVNGQATGEEARAVQVVKRVGAGRTLWFVLNTGAEPLRVELDSGGCLQEISLEQGRSPRLEKRGGRYLRDIYPFESFMLEACAASSDSGQSTTLASTHALHARSASEGEPLPHVAIPLRGPARIRLGNPNLLRLAQWQMSLLDADGAAAQTATVPAITLSDQLERGGFRFAPHVQRYFGHEPELEWPPLHVRYECTFALPGGPNPPAEIELVMEPGSIVGDWRLWVNKAGPLTVAGFAPSAAHVRGSLGVDITAMLRPGPNTLRIEIEGARPEGGLLNPLYLAGNFGVMLGPPRLVERPDIGGFETYEANCLPFFAGVIEYALDFDLEPGSPRPLARPDAHKGLVYVAEHLLADFITDEPFHEACEISINGGPWWALVWEPRLLELPTSELKPGRNEVRVKVYTTLIRAFEGQWFDYGVHCYQEITGATDETPLPLH